MGAVISKVIENIPIFNPFNLMKETFCLDDHLYPSHKRKHEEEMEVVSASKRKKLTSTSEYIYKTLFKNGEKYDVTVQALGRSWPLHRIYLKQSPYFEAMFSSNWRESTADVISIRIADENITVEALETTLGSMYSGEVLISGKVVVGVLACAMLLQLDNLIQLCTDIMRTTINAVSVVKYYNAASRYGVQEVSQSCQFWLECNLFCDMFETSDNLRSLTQPLLQSLANSSMLFVIQTELSVYILFKTWVFLQLHPEYDCDNNISMTTDAHLYFKNRQHAEDSYFLETFEGDAYRSLFAEVRLQHIVNHYSDISILNSDRILPLTWIQPAICYQWCCTLRITQNKDSGPVDVSEAEFNRSCSRYGRTLSHGQRYVWRWTGYNFGLDLVMHAMTGTITVRRNAPSSSLHDTDTAPARNIMYRVTLSGSRRGNTERSFYFCTGLHSVSLEKNATEKLASYDASLLDNERAVLLSIHLLVVTPPPGAVPPTSTTTTTQHQVLPRIGDPPHPHPHTIHTASSRPCCYCHSRGCRSTGAGEGSIGDHAAIENSSNNIAGVGNSIVDNSSNTTTGNTSSTNNSSNAGGMSNSGSNNNAGIDNSGNTAGGNTSITNNSSGTGGASSSCNNNGVAGGRGTINDRNDLLDSRGNTIGYNIARSNATNNSDPGSSNNREQNNVSSNPINNVRNSSTSDSSDNIAGNSGNNNGENNSGSINRSSSMIATASTSSNINNISSSVINSNVFNNTNNNDIIVASCSSVVQRPGHGSLSGSNNNNNNNASGSNYSNRGLGSNISVVNDSNNDINSSNGARNDATNNSSNSVVNNSSGGDIPQNRNNTSSSSKINNITTNMTNNNSGCSNNGNNINNSGSSGSGGYNNTNSSSGRSFNNTINNSSSSSSGRGYNNTINSSSSCGGYNNSIVKKMNSSTSGSGTVEERCVMMMGSRQHLEYLCRRLRVRGAEGDDSDGSSDWEYDILLNRDQDRGGSNGHQENGGLNNEHDMDEDVAHHDAVNEVDVDPPYDAGNYHDADGNGVVDGLNDAVNDGDAADDEGNVVVAHDAVNDIGGFAVLNGGDAGNDVADVVNDDDEDSDAGIMDINEDSDVNNDDNDSDVGLDEHDDGVLY